MDNRRGAVAVPCVGQCQDILSGDAVSQWVGASVHGNLPVPLLGVPWLTVGGWKGCPTWRLTATLMPTGLILWGTTLTMVSYA